LFRGLLQLTWLEIKIFVREPLGLFGTVGVPVLIFVVLGRLMRPAVQARPADVPRFVSTDLPIFVSLFMIVSAVLSLVTIISIYREGGILKRLRATPLQPPTILTAHVLVKLLFTAITLLMAIAAGRGSFPMEDVPVASFAVALLFSTVSALSLGFLIASVVPTARFAQPIGALILYPLIGLSGLFLPVAAMPPALQAVARVQPFTYAVSLLRGIWRGDGWSAHAADVVILAVIFVAFTAISSKVFRWE
jgi:ABC-2 type transport system permease protein